MKSGRIVGIHPAAELQRRRLLFAALEQAFEVEFEPLNAQLDAAIVFGDHDDVPTAGRVLRFSTFGPEHAAEPASVVLGSSRLLDERLRGATLSERYALGPALDSPDVAVTFARKGDRSTWGTSRLESTSIDLAACPPDELRKGEALRERLAPGRFLALLPLVHFLRELTAEKLWERPVPRATIILDDPNLHWTSYGRLDYRELVSAARDVRFHVVIATVPLDAWFARRASVELFRSHPEVVSLAIHGNDHVKRELRAAATPEDSRRVVAQAIRRIAALERRTGLEVSRVMIPRTRPARRRRRQRCSSSGSRRRASRARIRGCHTGTSCRRTPTHGALAAHGMVPRRGATERVSDDRSPRVLGARRVCPTELRGSAARSLRPRERARGRP